MVTENRQRSTLAVVAVHLREPAVGEANLVEANLVEPNLAEVNPAEVRLIAAEPKAVLQIAADHRALNGEEAPNQTRS